MPAICSLHPLPAAVTARLEARFALSFRPTDDDPSPAELIEIGSRVDGIITTVTDRLPAPVFEAPGRTARIVANFGVGVDLIDLAAAGRAGVTVTNTPGVLTDCTADLAIALMLMASRRLGEGERLIRSGGWTGWRPIHHLGRRVSGRTLGIVGMGRIGTAVARRARHGFGCRILVSSRSPVAPELLSELAAEPRSLDQLLEAADIVSLHCPATAETRNLLDARRIGLLRPDAILINTARGDLVDEEALVAALAAGRLAAAGLDVFRGEPAVSPALLAFENVVALPHLGSATVETRTAMGMAAADNLEAFFEGRPVPHPVVGPA